MNQKSNQIQVLKFNSEAIIIENLFNFKIKLKEVCLCPCHRIDLFGKRHWSAQMILSMIQCLECECKPYFIDAEEFAFFHMKTRIEFRKKYPGKTLPKWLRNDQIFLHKVRLLHEKTIKNNLNNS
jgi:hypothetical protein